MCTWSLLSLLISNQYFCTSLCLWTWNSSTFSNQKSDIHHTYATLQCWWRLEAKRHSPGSHGGLQFRCSWVVWDKPQVSQWVWIPGVHKVLVKPQPSASTDEEQFTLYTMATFSMPQDTSVFYLLNFTVPVNITNTTQHCRHERIPGNPLVNRRYKYKKYDIFFMWTFQKYHLKNVRIIKTL